MYYTVGQIKANRRNWIDSLASGELGQTTGRLANEDFTEFCCLGVAEDVVGPTLPDPVKISRIDKEDYFDSDGMFIMVDPYDNSEIIEAESVLHEELRVALGLSKEQQDILTTLNDSTSLSFPEIGDVISEMRIHLLMEDGTVSVLYSNGNAIDE